MTITVLLNYSSGNDSVESGSARAESKTDNAQDEYEPTEEERNNSETVKVTSPNIEAQWTWHDTCAGYRAQKIRFPQQCGPKKNSDSILYTSCVFMKK